MQSGCQQRALQRPARSVRWREPDNLTELSARASSRSRAPQQGHAGDTGDLVSASLGTGGSTRVGAGSRLLLDAEGADLGREQETFASKSGSSIAPPGRGTVACARAGQCARNPNSGRGSRSAHASSRRQPDDF
jgi:hypothetical protein